MEMEIEEGEYVRTKEGYILKNTILEHAGIIENLVEGDSGDGFKIGRIVKHSKNIIDLIEEGDYVNGKYVITKIKNKINNNELIVTGDLDYKCKTVIEYIETNRVNILGKEDIKSIVTKEIMESVEYRVED